jgi:hypothetical protein
MLNSSQRLNISRVQEQMQVNIYRTIQPLTAILYTGLLSGTISALVDRGKENLRKSSDRRDRP